MQQSTASLSSQLAFLPEAWELLESFQDTCTINNVNFRMAGFTARRVRDQVMVTGSACAWDRDPADTAWFELLERISLVTARSLPHDTRWCLRNLQSFEAHRIASSQEIFAASPKPELWMPAKSNGVAMGKTWQDAAKHALREVIERHLVLGSWYGAVAPERLVGSLPVGILPLKQSYRIDRYAMGDFALDDRTIHAAATLLWSKDGKKPVIYGFGAHEDKDEAVAKSLREALQRLAFLHDAEDVEAEAEFRPAPDFHQDHFLHPSQQAAIQRWLAGEHFQERFAPNLARTGKAHWVDLTPHDLFPGKVVQVFVDGALPLMFGRYAPPEFPDLHPDLFIHPIM